MPKNFLAYVINCHERLKLDNYQVQSLLWAYEGCTKLKKKNDEQIDLTMKILSSEQFDALYQLLLDSVPNDKRETIVQAKPQPTQ